MSASSFLPGTYRSWLLVEAATGLLLVSLLTVLPRGSSVLVVSVWSAISFLSLVWLGGGLRTRADAVTAVRVMLLLGWMWAARPSWPWSIVLALVLFLDLVDGWLARRSGSSEEGAVYDMEADQLGVLVLAYAAHARGLPAWVLLLPALKYAGILVSTFFGLPVHDPKPKAGDNRRGRFVCGFVFVALWIGVSPLSEVGFKTALAAAALSLLVLSFADDFRFLLRHRRARRLEAR